MKWTIVAALFALVLGNLAVSQDLQKPAVEVERPVPTVKSGDLPLYPNPARAARIQGEVTLRVATDGEKVTDVTVVKGPPMLAKAAQDNVKTWQFAKHPPTVFVTTFTFRLVPQAGCEPLHENGRLVLTLPTEVDISAPPNLGGCGPDAALDLTEPLRVFLTRCDVDGVSVPCDNVAIRLVNKGLEVTPGRFREKDGREGFMVPAVFRNLESFGVVVTTANGTFSIPDLHIGFLKGKWRVVIDHTPFQEEWRYLGKGKHCLGLIEFQWGEPGIIASSPCY